jgi:hypothetical protein
VQSVVKDEGFWVGSSQRNRVHVEYGGDVGVDENQGVEPSVGDKVNLTGPVRTAPENPARTLNLPTQGCPAGHRAGRLHQRRQRGDPVDNRQTARDNDATGVSPAKGPVPIIGAGPPASFARLIGGATTSPAKPPSGKASGKTSPDLVLSALTTRVSARWPDSSLGATLESHSDTGLPLSRRPLKRVLGLSISR